MAEIESKLHDALSKINALVDAALHEHEYHRGGNDEGGDDIDIDVPPEATTEPPSCTPRTLPARLTVKAAEVAFRLNPVNAPALAPYAQVDGELGVMDVQRIAVLTSKYWGARPRTLTVSFMETTPADLRRRIVSHLNAWTRTGCITFAETSGTGVIRISRGGGGYYSYLGTDVLLIPTNRQTMNLQGFTMSTSESEFRRVVRHEAGHTLGFPHEHMRRALVDRIDRQKAYAYFLRTQGWDQATVDQQVLTPLEERSLMATPADQTSIMCYQLPGSITKDGRPIAGGTDINANDYAFVGRIYPKPGTIGLGGFAEVRDQHDCGSAAAASDWDPAEDVDLSPEFEDA